MYIEKVIFDYIDYDCYNFIKRLSFDLKLIVILTKVTIWVIRFNLGHVCCPELSFFIHHQGLYNYVCFSFPLTNFDSPVLVDIWYNSYDINYLYVMIVNTCYVMCVLCVLIVSVMHLAQYCLYTFFPPCFGKLIQLLWISAWKLLASFCWHIAWL